VLGYHVLRTESLDEPFQPINEDLIPVSGPGGILVTNTFGRISVFFPVMSIPIALA
jgi:hypothetical protein